MTTWQRALADAVMDNYGTPPVALSAARARTVLGRRRQRLPRPRRAASRSTSLGHAHPAVVAAVTGRSSTLGHTSNLFVNEPPSRSPSGCSALAGRAGPGVLLQQRRRGQRGGVQARPAHRPHAASSPPRAASTAARWARSRSPASRPSGRRSRRCPATSTSCPTATSRRCAAAVDETTAAVVLEPIQGEGGVVPPPAGYLAPAARDRQRDRRAARPRRGADRHRPHRATGSPTRPRASRPTSSRWPRGSAAGCRSARASPSARRPSCSRPASTAPPSAATRSSCAAAPRRARHHRVRGPAGARQASWGQDPRRGRRLGHPLVAPGPWRRPAARRRADRASRAGGGAAAPRARRARQRGRPRRGPAGAAAGARGRRASTPSSRCSRWPSTPQTGAAMAR